MKPESPSEIELCTIPLSSIVDKDNEIADLKAHINSLREAIQSLIRTQDYKILLGKDATYQSLRENSWVLAKHVFNSTPTQSLAEHDHKVIAKFIAKCKVEAWLSRDRNGNREYWAVEPAFLYKPIPLYILPPIDNEEK